ncbi:T6SS effector BTH_I2691 family protein [Ralstonia sp. ASV6]|uniref:T6SS effector BTH_I2691 family protein n=1 Tax=Ralstonia sp. ASV6 TaxID=2795124 RepID=UPI0018EC95FB|nr:T6SS effector BTH_I2691 family protein [Ralstonia sp. ASV6]
MPPSASPSQFCEQCKATGLPILPVRYAVVPKNINPALPDWVSGDRVKSVALGNDFHYALRTLRTGYLYLFYDKNARGSKQWECYAVGDDGSLTRQHDPKSAQPQSTPVLQCSRHGANNTQVHYLVIEHPERCGATWIAYSEHKWSDETLAEYEKNSKLRNKRMQTIQPGVMAAGAKHSHGQIADKAVLEAVLEYAPTTPKAPLPFNPPVGTLSNEDGSCLTSRLEQMSTRYPWHFRTDMAEGTVKHMESRGKGTGKPSKPHVLALWDAMGIAHELNGFRNDAAGWIKKYGDERELQITALNSYGGLQKALENRAQTQGEEYIQRGVEDGPLQDGIRELEEKLKSSPDDEYLKKQLEQFRSLQSTLSSSAPQVGAAFGKSMAAKAWPQYQDRIDDAAGRFKKKLDEFQAKAAGIVDRRTVPLIHWLEATLLLDTLNDYHGQNVQDGLRFEQDIGEAIFGLGSCKSGAQKITEWVKQCKASVESNLLWRTVALNQDKAREELDAKLAEAERHKSSQTLASTLTWVGYTAKSMKAIADTYKKAQSVFDANTKAGSTAGSKAFGATINSVKMRGVDKAMITFGDAVFKHFRIDKLGDYVSEKIIQHIFSIRALVNPMESEDLIAKQVAAEKLGREQALRRLQAAKAFMKMDTPEIRSKQAQDLKDAWAKFKVSDDAKAPQAIKDARLAVVVMLIEGVNFSKLMAECKTKNDMKSWLSLLASGMSITSALLDIATVPVKNLPGMGAETWGYQVLKGWGGVLSGGASVIGGGLDVADAVKNYDKGYGYLTFLYAAKGIVGIGSGFLTWAVTFTYAAPLVARLTGRAAAGVVIEAIGARAAAFVGLRILGMAAGGWVTVGLFGIQVIIWIVTPNAIEIWIDHSAFGKKRKSGGYQTAKEQDEKLSAALVEMGFQ